MPILDRETILQAEDLNPVEVDVPEWGGSVLVRGMTGTERDEFDLALSASRDDTGNVKLINARALMCSMCIVDESGQRLFTTEDVTVLGCKSSIALDRVFDAAQRMSLTRNKDVDELAKN